MLKWSLVLTLQSKIITLKIVEKLQNTQRGSKAYWPLLKIFSNNKKIPVIPPLYHNNEFVTDFKKKN